MGNEIERAEAAAQEAGTSGNAPSGLAQIVEAAQAFIAVVKRIGPAQFGDQAAAALDRTGLAWVIDRLDDALGVLAECLGELATSVAATVAADGDAFDYETTVARLAAIGEGLYAAMQELDPDGERHSITGLQAAAS